MPESTVICGDSLLVLPTLDAESVDAIVCDPPYGLSFMGKEWDHGVPGEPFWREALRVAKPGAHLVAFGGTRTYHRLAVAIEDAGWEIRDCLSWLYGSGFPKSLDVSKAMDKAAGAERTEIIGTRSRNVKPFDDGNGWNANNTTGDHNYTAPATDLARQWQGWGTALKPAWEPIILARKPLMGTVAANVTAYGTGALNVDGCRIGTEERLRGTGARESWRKMEGRDDYVFYVGGDRNVNDGAGRWPANVCLDEEAAAMFPESRFFYTAKASRREREAGLEGMPEREAPKQGGAPIGRVSSIAERGGNIRSANHHPTVKPIALMRWLCRLVTPKGGLILDPFTGSGTTGCAAVLEGFRFVGVEREPEYAAIAEKRIAHWAGQREPAEQSLFDG